VKGNVITLMKPRGFAKAAATTCGGAAIVRVPRLFFNVGNRDFRNDFQHPDQRSDEPEDCCGNEMDET
jgi:hypothetical protein